MKERLLREGEKIFEKIFTFKEAAARLGVGENTIAVLYRTLPPPLSLPPPQKGWQERELKLLGFWAAYSLGHRGIPLPEPLESIIRQIDEEYLPEQEIADCLGISSRSLEGILTIIFNALSVEGWRKRELVPVVARQERKGRLPYCYPSFLSSWLKEVRAKAQKDKERRSLEAWLLGHPEEIQTAKRYFLAPIRELSFWFETGTPLRTGEGKRRFREDEEGKLKGLRQIVATIVELAEKKLRGEELEPEEEEKFNRWFLDNGRSFQREEDDLELSWEEICKPRLSPEAERIILELIRRENQPLSSIGIAARNLLVEHHLGFLITLAKEVAAQYPGIPLTDLVQEAIVSFIGVLGNFDLSKGVKLTTFVGVCVERDLFRYVKKIFSSQQGEVSLEEPLSSGEEEMCLLDFLRVPTPSPEEQVVSKIDWWNLERRMAFEKAGLTPVEEQVLRLYRRGCTPLTIAKKFGRGKPWVTQNLRRALAKLQRQCVA